MCDLSTIAATLVAQKLFNPGQKSYSLFSQIFIRMRFTVHMTDDGSSRNELGTLFNTTLGSAFASTLSSERV